MLFLTDDSGSVSTVKTSLSILPFPYKLRTWIIPLSSMMETTPNVDEELFTLPYYMSSPRFLMWFVLLVLSFMSLF